MGMVEGPITIPEEALVEPEFNHKNVYLKITKIRTYQDDSRTYRDDEIGQYSFPMTLVVCTEQPEHPELEEFGGFSIDHWLRTDPKSVRDYKEFCSTFDIDPLHPDFSTVEGATVIAQLKTNHGKGKNADKVFHNVYRIQPA